MKKICNMTYEDARKSFASFSKKHSIKDDFDMNYSIINAVQPLLTDKEAVINTFYDVFCYGFMAGYKQKEKEVKDHMESHMFNESQRKLVELAYYLPFGKGAEYFYTFMALKLHYDYEQLETFLPAKQHKPFIECYKASEQRIAKRREEADRKREQKEATMTPEEKEQRDLKFEMQQKALYVDDVRTIKQILEIIKSNERGLENDRTAERNRTPGKELERLCYKPI